MTASSHSFHRQPRRPPQSPCRVRRGAWRLLGFVARLLRGVLAAVVLVALLAGLPWALTHFIGLPVPDHLPSWAEAEGVLLGPMTVGFLLDFLACAAWLVWALFTLDMARCAVRIARDARLPDLSAAGPVHRVAAVLVGAVLLSIPGNRLGPTPASPPYAGPAGSSGVVVTAPTWHHQPDQGAGGVRVADHAAPDHAAPTHAAPRHAAPRHTAPVPVGQSASVKADLVRPYDPDTGVYDSLWRMSERTLGDGNRWPEIFELNKGKSQPDGGAFTRPSLIFPGEEMALPDDATVPAAPPARNAPPPPTPVTPPPVTPTPTPDSTTTPAPSTQAPRTTQATPPFTRQAPPQPDTDATTEPGLRWGEELFVGLGLASAVSTALVVARRRHRRRYRPGSGDRTDLPVAPVVYRLRLAHLRAEQDDADPDPDGDHEGAGRPQRAPSPPALVVGASGTGSCRRRPAFTPALGVRDGREIALDLGAARGLGLVGAGAPAAVRALAVAALTGSAPHSAATSPGTGIRALVPADDLAWVFGRGARHARLPAALRVVGDLDEALDVLEAETLVRAGADRERNTASSSWPALVLVARPSEHRRQRLQAVLDNGAPFGITGLLLGQWRPGVTAYVREDGTVSATGPGVGEALRGTRMFRLGADDTTALLTLLHQAQPGPPGDDEAVSVPPMPRPGTVPTEPARNHHPAPGEAGASATGATGGRGVGPEPDTGLEVTAATAGTPVRADTGLEILGSGPAAVTGVRLRPAPVPRRQPAPPRLPEDTGVAEDSGDEPAQTGGHPTTAAHPSPDTTAAGDAAETPTPIAITVLGAPRVHWYPEPGPEVADTDRRGREITGAFQPRTQELLVLLALHPDGATRDALVSALWGQDPPARPTNALHTALSRMRHTLAAATDGTVTDMTVVGNGRYQLDPAVVRVDYWWFAAAVAARRAATTDHTRVAAYRDVVDSYGGPLADGLSTEWIESAREAIRRDAIDAVAALARALVASDPQQTLDLLEVARAFDPHNELLYRDIMRLQERLGQLDAIPRTLTLLTTRLAEIDETPTPQARALAARLGQRHDDITPATPTTPLRPVGDGERGHSAAW